MLRVFILCVFVVLGCGGGQLQAEAAVADAVARGINPVVHELVDTYQRQGDHLIDTASSTEEAERRMTAHQERWKLVRRGIAILKAQHDAWVDMIEAGRSGMASDIAQSAVLAYCALLRAVAIAMPEWTPPKYLPTVPCQKETP